MVCVSVFIIEGVVVNKKDREFFLWCLFFSEGEDN